MKKILFALLLLTACIGQSQVSKVKAVEHKGVTTAERDALTTTSVYPVIYNTTTGQFERWNGSAWEEWGAAGSTQLSDLTDVNTSTPTNRFVLVADGVDFESRLLTEADISDLQSYLLPTGIDTFAELNTIVADATLLKSGDNISTLTNDSGYITSQTDDQIASEVPFTATGNIVATDVQAAIAEVDSETARIDSGTPRTATIWGPGTKAEFYADYPYPSSGFPSNGVAFITDSIPAAVSFDTLSDITKGTPATESGATLRVLADPDTDGNYNEIDWTPPSGGLSTTDIDTSAEIAAIVTDETGSGALVFATSPTLVTPALGTPSSGVLTNATGLPLTTGVTGTLPVANGGTGVTSSTGTGNVVLSASPTFTGTPVLPSTFTVGANSFTRSGAHNLTLTTNGVSTVTLPNGTSTMASLTGTQTLTNKTFTSPVINTQISGTVTSGGDITSTNYLVGATATQTLTNKTIDYANNTVVFPVDIGVACSDETTDLTTGTAKVTFRAPYAFTITDVRASVNTAPVGSTIIVDINESGTSIMTTNKLSIDASETTSTTAATAAGVTDTSIADDAEITIDIDQVGSTTAGKGLKIWIIGTRTL